MRRIVYSVLIAIGVHGFLLSADFKLPWSLVEPTAVPDRLTVVMIPAPSQKPSVDPEPLPAKKRLPTLLPPPAPELLAKTRVAELPDALPTKIPDAIPAPSAQPPNPKKSLKAQTYKPRPQPTEPEPKRQPVTRPQLKASTQKPVATPQPAAPGTAAAEEAPKKRTSVAAVHKPRKFLPDRPAIPLLKQNPPPRYPKRARRRGYQGSVVLKVLVAADGSVEEVEIDQSCGYEILDRTALSAVRGWQFEPGIKDGKKTRMWVKVPVRFELK